MVVRLEGLPPLAAVPTDDTQVSSGENTYTISMPPAPDSPLTRPQGGEGFAEDLQPDPLVQADHPDIRALAQQIVGAESDLWRSAQLLYEWVYTYIKKEPVPSVPSALDVLATREGDCNEHTVFYAALARAVGIPTRIAVGLVWSDELDGFYYHAWPEVYAGRWIWVDPTLGQPIADATHIKLVSGGIGKWPQIMMYLGQVKAEVLEIE
jgi:transglutaminase-like putative cysteine protease